MDDDDDFSLPYERPLDIALILDGHDPGQPPEDDGATLGQECASG